MCCACCDNPNLVLFAYIARLARLCDSHLSQYFHYKHCAHIQIRIREKDLKTI